jgi:hypothetical protein
MTPEQLVAAGNFGATLVGSDAVAAGLADRVATFEDMMAGLVAGTQSNAGLAAGPRAGANAAPPAAVSTGQHGKDETAMTDKSTTQTAAAPKPADPPTTAAAAAINPDEIRKQAIAEERARIAGIDAIAIPGHEALVRELKENGTSVGDAAIALAKAEKAARDKALDHVAATDKVLPMVVPSADPEAGAAAADDRGNEIDAVAEKAGAEWDKDPSVRDGFVGRANYVSFKQAEASGVVRMLEPRRKAR